MAWRDAEAAYEDEVIGESPLPRLFEESATRNIDQTYQRYKGGICDRSLCPDPIPEAPDGTFGSLTYGEVAEIVRRLAAGFRELGLDHGDRVGLFAQTRMEWAQTDLAILAGGGVVTTVYESSSASNVEYLLSDSEAIGVVAEGAEHVERVRAVEENLDLSFIVRMDGEPVDAADEYTLGEVYEIGAEAFDRETYEGWIDDIDPDDLASLVYTSGTTGQPKGVQLTHWNIRANVNQVRKRYGPRSDKPPELARIDVDTVGVSFLPLAHIFERTAGHFTMLAAGATVAYAESPDTLQEDFQTIRPTVATSVPRVYEKIYAAIREQAQSSSIKERIFHWAVGVGEEYHHAEDPGTILQAKRAVADRLVFQKVREALGGNIEMLISGGGSLSPDLAALYHGMGLPVYEGYGLTETAPVATCNPIEEPKVGTIGPPLVDMEVKIEAGPVPDETEGEVGELHLRGPNVSSGYWNKPEATKRAFDDDGWFHTGDIVKQRPDGYLEFVERAKEVLVLSTGKNVAPGPIEDAFAPSDVVEQCMVVGEGEKFVGALIVPNEDAVRERLDGETLPSNPSEMCGHDAVEELIQAEVDAVNEEFEDYETIKRFRAIPQEFTEDNDFLTPTMKKKRRNIVEAFEDEIDEIYAEG